MSVNLNPDNSTLVQSLIEMARLTESDELRAKIQTFMAEISPCRELIRQADAVVAAKGYKDQDVSFGRRYRLVDMDLSTSAYKVFDILTAISGQSGLVQVSPDVYADIGMSKPTFLQAIRELLEHGCLKLHTAPNRKAGIPATYMINPELYSCSKPSHYQRLVGVYEALDGSDFEATELLFESVTRQDDDTVIKAARLLGTKKADADTSPHAEVKPASASAATFPTQRISLSLDISQGIDAEMPF